MVLSVKVVGEHNGATLIYSIPTKISETEFCTSLAPYKGRPWIWIINCKGANVSNLSLIQSLYRIIEVEHAASLQHVWLVNMNVLVRPLLQMLPTQRVSVLPHDRLEIFVLLQRAGFSHVNVDLFLAIVDPAASRLQSLPPSIASIDK
jgi:hypothetical protein